MITVWLFKYLAIIDDNKRHNQLIIAVVAPEGTAKVSWTVNSSETDLNQDTDYVIAVFYGTTINKYILDMKIAARKDVSFVASFPFVFYGHPVQGWIFLVSADGKRVSNSEYLGQLLNYSLTRF
ncbi:DUF6266 family protein [Pedobacter hartonius]|uniref:Uncharacterized protein n=1 Tax=Pedobacter hartonius TaxID=425514 RepID=A0A1H4B6J0_9SPHI|nr:DUF6266 family protein [Pedobacter hartonius]SEA43813.1 hypothetical protein SAMN05443550_103226 [Pedobacter hartonius]